MRRNAAVNPHKPPPTTTTSSTSEAYPTGWDPSKPAGPFYGAYFAVLGVVMPFLGPYLRFRGAGPVAIGLITALFSLSKLGYAPWLAVRVDRGFWFRGLLSVHLIVSAVAVGFLPYWSAPVTLGLLLFVAGTGHGAVLPLVEASVLERVGRYVYGRLRLWGSVGFVVTAVAGGVLVDRAGLASVPYLVAGAILVTWLTVVPFERHGAPVRTAATNSALPTTVWALLGLLTAHQVLHGPYYAFFSIHLQHHGFPGTHIAGLWSLAVLAEMAAFAIGGRLERRWGLRRLLGAALLLAPLRWAVLAVEPTLPVLLTAQLGHAPSYAVAHLAGIQLIQRIAPADAARHAQALYAGLTFGLGIVAGTAAAGPLYAAVAGRGSFAVAALLGVPLALAWLPLARRLDAEGR